MSSSWTREDFITHLQHSPHIQAAITIQNNYSVTSEQQERITNDSLSTHLSECDKTCRPHLSVKDSSCDFRCCMVSQTAHCSARDDSIARLHSPLTVAVRSLKMLTRLYYSVSSCRRGTTNIVHPNPKILHEI